MDETERSKRAQTRLLGLTIIVILVFVAAHTGLPEVLRLIQRCAASQSGSGSGTVVSVGALAAVGYLYARAVVELGCLVYVRWLRRAEFRAAVGIPPVPEPPSGIATPREQIFMFVLATALITFIVRCSGLDPWDIMGRGPFARIIAGVAGWVVVTHGAWFIRVLEPYLPFE